MSSDWETWLSSSLGQLCILFYWFTGVPQLIVCILTSTCLNPALLGYLEPTVIAWPLLCSGVMVYFCNSDDSWLSNCLHIRKVIRLVIVSKHDLQLSAGPTREGFSHVHPIIRVLNRSWFLSNQMGKIITYCWLDIIQKPALPLTEVFWWCRYALFDLNIWIYCKMTLIFPAESVQTVYHDTCTDKQCSLSTVSHSGGRAHSGSATVRCLCCWQRSFISARVSVYFNSCGLELYSLIPMTSSAPFFSDWMVYFFLL